MLSQLNKRSSPLFTSKSKLRDCYGKLTYPNLVDFYKIHIKNDIWTLRGAEEDIT